MVSGSSGGRLTVFATYVLSIALLPLVGHRCEVDDITSLKDGNGIA